MPEVPAGRDTCYRCFRPAMCCLCGVIPSVDNRTEVVILQHPRERTHAFGTARLAALGLRRIQVLVDHLGRLRQDSSPLGPLAGCALLYPGAEARDITCLPAAEHPRRLFVIDGTWHHARTLYRDIPVLRALPHLTLPGHLRSTFEIRRQPAVHCLSTIEAIVFALRALEPETEGLDGLLGAFASMQGQQLALPRDAGRQRRNSRKRASRAIPRSLIEGYESLVVAYGEPTFDAKAESRRRLLCCTAERPSTGERFERVLKQPDVSVDQLEYLGLDPHAVENGVTLEQFQADWSAFLRRGDSLATWHQSTLNLLCAAAGAQRAGVALKGAYHNLKRFRGSLEDIVAQEALEPQTSTNAARATTRLNDAVSVAKFLHRHGNGPSS